MAEAIRRSSRAGRGNLMAGLIATEEIEKQPTDDFWSADGKGAALWNSAEKELDDREFGEGSSQDSEDDDINLREDPELDTEVLGEVPEEKKPKKKGAYVDPKRRKTKAELQQEKEKEARDARREKKAVKEKESLQQQGRKRRLSKGGIDLSAPTSPVAVDRKLRASTVSISKERSMQRELELQAERETLKKEGGHAITEPVKKYTQMQLLEEAKSTEVFNTSTLEQMKKLEAIKKKPVPVRKKIASPRIIEMYRPEANYVIFEGPLPSLFNEGGNIRTH